ncbi:rRNA-processing protein EBP2-like protein [Sarcoptes scabiei]|uniref:rRNA-processing protein EBP2-like protein n=1 Tax=Sarcoptes scabiei TaxID=52283 RepID=A0A132A9J3_SARSC|nr:rRNA-processing protein EBP2-like protein [Sarcoptes scabiei]
MGKSKLILEKILHPDSDEDESIEADRLDDSMGQNSDGNELDSDAELEAEFAKGNLKPGLYGMVPMKRKTMQINDKKSLLRKLEEIRIFEDDWLERLDMISKPVRISPELSQQYGDLNLKMNRKGQVSNEELSGNDLDDTENDFKREFLFYRQAQSTVIDSIKLLRQKFGITNIFRPEDYFAEMLKSDEHMEKVQKRLESKQISIELSEKAKRQRELKKFGKKVQQEVKLKRQQEKKELLEKIQKYKKGKLDSLDFLDENNNNNRSAMIQKISSGKQPSKKKSLKVSRKKQYKEARYGYGGQKKRSKYNSAESAADVSSFSARKHGRPILKGKNGKSKNRLGKSRRQKLRNRSK